MKPVSEEQRRTPAAARFSLIELVMLLSLSAITCALIAKGVVMLGFCFLVTAVAFRTSIVDFSMIGSMAVLFTMFFGTVSIALLVLWSAGWF